ncbi:hypothetical protein CMUS01_15609 [Colletotrichum musicola]|uniref:Uncharacterized protein n=1 Tax=Colletotrichum musicola TaxID=2175873 RepID=A0A8H6MMF8_9PEZI|nr:hypothetical protein CMUS01_15609 [Colletotrichum musicola]
MEAHSLPYLGVLGRDQTIQDDFPLLSLLMSESRWPFNKNIVHHHGQEITKAVFVIETQPPLTIGFGFLQKFTSFTFPKVLEGFARSQDDEERIRGLATPSSSDSASPWDTSSEQSSVCGTEVDAVEAKDGFSDTESTFSDSEILFAESEHPRIIAQVSTKLSAQAALLDAWRETEDDFSDIQWPPSSSGPDILSVKSKHYGSVVKVSAQAPAKAVLVGADSETANEASGIQCPPPSSTQTTQLNDGNDDDIFSVRDCSDAIKISDVELTLLWYQETQEDEIEDSHLECDVLDDLDHSMADINEGVMSYEDYIAQDIIQQFWSDMDEQLSSSARSSTTTKSASYHTVSWLDCQAYLQETYGQKEDSSQTAPPATSFYPSRSLNARLRRQATLATARSFRSSQGSVASQGSHDSVITQVACEQDSMSNNVYCANNSLRQSRGNQAVLVHLQSDGLAAPSRPVMTIHEPLSL